MFALLVATTRGFRGSIQKFSLYSIQKSCGTIGISTKLFSSDNGSGGANFPTVQQAWSTALELFQEKGVSEPEWSVAHLLASALDLPWSNGFSQLQRAVVDCADKNLCNRPLTEQEWNQYQAMIQRRLEDEPLQYILGKWDFLDYEQLIIRPPLLCPRPETEELVELVRKDTINSQSTTHSLQLLDVGCGTGVIGIALADAFPTAKVVAIDIEPVAVETSKENARRILGIDSEDRYSAVRYSADDYKTDNLLDVVVSNPPYIPRSDMETLEQDVVRYESDQALCGGDDGMDVIRTIVRKWSTEWGKRPSSTCWMEVDPSHPKLLEAWLDEEEQRRALGVYLESSHRDLSGRDRFVKLAFRNES